jgi:hypothetical protein
VISDVGADIRAIFRASHDAIKFANRSENHGRAGLQGNNPSRGVVNRHDKAILQAFGFDARGGRRPSVAVS